MAVELAGVAAGLPLGVSFAVAGGIAALRDGRRRTALNEAMHELRRPLQVLALALPADSGEGRGVDSSLQMAVAALDRLDCAINGSPEAGGFTALSVRSLLEDALHRWQAQALMTQRSIQLCWSAEEMWVDGDRCALAQAVDNLISNAFIHGRGEVTIVGRRQGDRLLICIRDAGADDLGRRRISRRRLGSGRNRHGHGLRVVTRIARSHGGSLRLERSQRGFEARLQLPLSSRRGAG